MKDLPWPHNLFAQTVVLESQNKLLPPGMKCDWVGCNRPHNNHVTWQRRGYTGHGWHISYYCCDDHKSRAVVEASK